MSDHKKNFENYPTITPVKSNVYSGKLTISFIGVICPFCDSHFGDDEVIEDYEKMKGYCPKCHMIICDLVPKREKVVFT